MSNSSKRNPPIRLAILVPNPTDPNGDPLPVEALLPQELSSAAALAALIDAASMDAGVEFGDFLTTVASFSPEIWEPPKNKGGAPIKNHWKDDYGLSAEALAAKVELRFGLPDAIRNSLANSTVPERTKQTKAEVRREVLKKARRTAAKHALPEDRIKLDAEKLKEKVRGKRPTK